MLARRLNLLKLLEKKSFFLFGPWSAGKSTLIRDQLPEARVYDLLDAVTLNRLMREPQLLEQEGRSEKNGQIVVIDEVQKAPFLLDEVHRLIQKNGTRFLLTGSSARKLRHGGANLLAGRAWQAELFGLTAQEIPDFELSCYLTRGGLPQVYLSEDYKEDLHSYVSTYLVEEVQAEALTRNIRAFSAFLDLVGLSNGQEINFEKIASDTAVSADTIRNYFQILEDTLLGFRLEAFTKTKKRKAITRAKHYLFDVGVANALSGIEQIKPKTKAFGEAFEHFIVLEIRAYNSYLRKRHKLHYWRSTSQFEVDVIIDQEAAIEIKASEQVNENHLKGLRALKEEQLIKKYLVVSLDPEERVTKDGIRILPWKKFLDELWGETLFSEANP